MNRPNEDGMKELHQFITNELTSNGYEANTENRLEFMKGMLSSWEEDIEALDAEHEQLRNEWISALRVEIMIWNIRFTTERIMS